MLRHKIIQTMGCTDMLFCLGLLIVILHSSILSALADEPAPILLPENPIQGTRLFLNKGCMNCHAILGYGGTKGPDLGKIQLKHSFLGIARIMWSHSPRMEREFKEMKIPRPEFSSQEMANLIAFLYYLNYFFTPGDTDRGRRLFSEKKCSLCHSLGGKGGKSASALDRYVSDISPVFITTGFWNQSKKMISEMIKKGIKTPKLMGDEINDILAYIRDTGILNEKNPRLYLPPGSPTAGKQVFEEKGCKKCHTVLGEGGKKGQDLGRSGLKRSLTEIAGILWNSSHSMGFREKSGESDLPKFNEVEMSSLLTYLYFLQYIDKPGNSKAGERLFTQKKCINCHSLRGVGGKVGPDLAKVEHVGSTVDFITHMWNHAVKMEAKTWEKGIPWPELTTEELSDIIAFIQSRSETH